MQTQVEQIKRNTYLAVFAIGGLVFVLDALIGVIKSIDQRLSLGVFLFSVVMITLILARKVDLQVIGRVTYGAAVLALLLALGPARQEDLHILSYSLYPWLIVSFILGFLVFGTKVGILLALGVMGLALVPVVVEDSFDKELLAEFLLSTMLVLALLFIFARMQDALATKEAEVQLMARLSNTDALTKVYNRRYLHEALDQEIARAQRYKRPLSIVFFDIDHFKRINDTYGHLVGDTVLQEISALGQGLLRKSDVLGRWGGEEFIILVPELTATKASKMAERIRSAIEEHHFAGVDGKVTASFGVTEYDGTSTADQVVNKVDALLYQAKEGGRNRVALAE